MNSELMNRYTNILKEELEVALGCTEPISIAYASSKASELLGKSVERIEVFVSGNIIKNAKSVIVPNTKDLKGVRASAILGALYGNADLKLEVLSCINEQHVEHARELRKTDFCKYFLKETPLKLYIEVIVYHAEEFASCIIKNTHTNITELNKNGEIVFKNECDDTDFNTPISERKCLNVENIYEYTNSVPLENIIDLIELQIELNSSIAYEGLKNDYGLSVGKTILEYSIAEDYISLAKAFTASGSDARMSGSVLPVVTNSGSGNQGMTASLPIISFANSRNVTKEELIRALVLSNLITIHIKTNLGRLSAFCGAVVAGVGSACGIAYLHHATKKQIEAAIVNMLANISGIFCDGAKPSCAAKIASSVDAAFLSANLALRDKVVEIDTGIITEELEKTIKNVGDIGRCAMVETDKMILEIMTYNHN